MAGITGGRYRLREVFNILTKLPKNMRKGNEAVLDKHSLTTKNRRQSIK